MMPEQEREDAAQVRAVRLAWSALAVFISAAIATGTILHNWGVW